MEESSINCQGIVVDSEPDIDDWHKWVYGGYRQPQCEWLEEEE